MMCDERPFKRQAIVNLLNAISTRLASVLTLVHVTSQRQGPSAHVRRRQRTSPPMSDASNVVSVASRS